MTLKIIEINYKRINRNTVKYLYYNKCKKLRYSTFNKTNDVLAPNGERIVISNTGLPVKVVSWSDLEAQLLGMYQRLHIPMEQLYLELPTRTSDQINKRYSSYHQIPFTTDEPNYMDLPNITTRSQRKLVNLNNQWIDVTPNLLPSKTGAFSANEIALINILTTIDEKMPHLTQLMPTRSLIQLISYKKYNEMTRKKEGVGIPNRTSIYGFELQTSKLSEVEAQLFNLAKSYYNDLTELTQYLPNRSLSQLSRFKDNDHSVSRITLNQKSIEAKNDQSTNINEVRITSLDLPCKIGPYSTEEKLLLDKLSQLNFNYNTMSKHMGTRTRAQLSSYFLRIKRQKKVGPWNLDEIERFNKSIKTNFPNINEIIKSDDVHLASTIWPRLAIDVGTRTPSQCRYRWFVVSDPSIVKYKSFTEDEDRIILSMNKKVPSLPEIALSLPHRSYSQVKTRINSLSAKRRKKWSEQEIELLLKGIELYGLSEWKKVSEYVDTRNQSQCQHKYIVNRYSIDYYFKKFRNVTKEDSDLINKLEKYFPQQPLTISLLVPGYTLNQIKYTLLTHKLKNKTQLYALNRRWTPDEYSTLYDMFLAYGADWEKIASCLPDDITPIHCKYKLQVTTSSRKCIKPHIMLVREALRLKYNEEKENGKFMPKERVYYRG